MNGGIRLEARNVHFEYAPGRPVVCGASLALDAGVMGALIGSNGCGKSTLLRLLDGLLLPAQDDKHHKADRNQQSNERPHDRHRTEPRSVGDAAGAAGRGKDRNRATAVGAFAVEHLWIPLRRP